MDWYMYIHVHVYHDYCSPPISLTVTSSHILVSLHCQHVSPSKVYCKICWVIAYGVVRKCWVMIYNYKSKSLCVQLYMYIITVFTGKISHNLLHKTLRLFTSQHVWNTVCLSHVSFSTATLSNNHSTQMLSLSFNSSTICCTNHMVGFNLFCMVAEYLWLITCDNYTFHYNKYSMFQLRKQGWIN